MEKKNVILAAMAFCGAALLPAVSQAADGTMTFNGTIQSVTCEIAGPSGANGDFTVTLPTLGTSALKSGTSAGQTNFAVSLSGANCTDGKTASILIESAQTPLLNATNGTLKNAGQSNVEIGLINATSGQKINLATGANMPTAVISGNAAKLDFVAQYEANNGDATSGDVTTNATYSVTYN